MYAILKFWYLDQGEKAKIILRFPLSDQKKASAPMHLECYQLAKTTSPVKIMNVDYWTKLLPEIFFLTN